MEEWNEKHIKRDVSDEEWAFVAPYLSLMTEEAPQREHSLREVFNGQFWIIRAGASWRMMLARSATVGSSLSTKPKLVQGRCV